MNKNLGFKLDLISMLSQMSRKRILGSAGAFILSFMLILTLLSVNGFHTWFRSVLFEGAWREYNMAKEIYHVYPFIGRTGYFNPYQVLALFAVSGSTAAYIVTLINRKYIDVGTRYILFILPIMIASAVIAGISVAAQDCILGLDDIIAEYFNPTLATYINAGPSQLALISTMLGIFGVLAIYIWASDYSSVKSLFSRD